MNETDGRGQRTWEGEIVPRMWKQRCGLYLSGVDQSISSYKHRGGRERYEVTLPGVLIEGKYHHHHEGMQRSSGYATSHCHHQTKSCNAPLPRSLDSVLINYLGTSLDLLPYAWMFDAVQERVSQIQDPLTDCMRAGQVNVLISCSTRR